LEVEGAAIGESQDEAREAALRAADSDSSERGPIDLSLLSGQDREAQKGFARWRAELSDDTAQVWNGALVAAIAQHVEEPGSPQAGVLFESRGDQFEKGIGGARGGSASLIEGVGPQGALDSVRMQTEFRSDGSDFPMLGVKEATDVGKLFGSNHVSPRFNKRIEKTPDPSTEMADDSSECGEKRPPWRLARRGDGWRGDDAGSEWRIGSMIHNGFLSLGAGEVGLAPAVLSLPVPLIVPRFRTLAVSAASGAALFNTGKLPAVGTAVSMVAITVGTNEEEAATLSSVAKDLTKREFRGRRDQNHRAGGARIIGH